jgi:hypothetical protein
MSEKEEVLEQEEISNDPSMEDTSIDEVASESGEEPEVLEKAKSTGYLTKEEFVAKGGDPKKYKTPEEFVRTGEMIDQIYSIKKVLEKRDKEVEAIYKYQQETIAEHKRRARAEIETRLAEAMQIGDVENVQRLTQEKTQLDYKEHFESQQRAAQSQMSALSRFVENNKHWFNDQHPELKARTVQLDSFLRTQNPYITYDELASRIEAQMKFEFPEIVGRGVVSRPNLSASRSAIAKSEGDSDMSGSDDKIYSKLTDQEKAMYQVHKRISAKIGADVSVKEFVQKLKQDREI